MGDYLTRLSYLSILLALGTIGCGDPYAPTTEKFCMQPQGQQCPDREIAFHELPQRSHHNFLEVTGGPWFLAPYEGAMPECCYAVKVDPPRPGSRW